MAQSTILVALDGGSAARLILADKIDQVCSKLGERGHKVVLVHSAADAVAFASAQDGLAAALVSCELTNDDKKYENTQCNDVRDPAEVVLKVLLDRFSSRLPVFLVTTGDYVDEAPLWVSKVVNGWIWLLEDTPDFITDRIDFAASQYFDHILPPFFRELRQSDDTHEHSWHTPAHAGGAAFLKSPVGRAFFDYYGEQLLRTDISASVGEFGSLLEHTGLIGNAERNAARVFGADYTYFVLHGTSTSDRLVIHATVATNDTVLLDRNCHKAINHGITLAGARPVYLVPTRNGYGITGPIPPSRLAGVAVRDQIQKTRRDTDSTGSVYAVITNSTYDGLCYDAVRVAKLLGETTPRLHFDEAWFAYARFNPLYAYRYGMAVDAQTLSDAQRPTIFATQSPHKLLAALSQSSMVHVKNSERAPFEPVQFNETYMMHATTSPLYPLIASLDIATGMMDGASGHWLTTEAITEAIRFRQAMVRLNRRIVDSEDRPSWFFGVWQPTEVIDTDSHKKIPFDKAPLDLLRSKPSCWTLVPGADWHGFSGLEDGFCMLDPMKVTITCPGVDAKGTITEFGIPARIVTAYLETRRIVVEKTDAYSFLVLFSMGITKDNWGTLLDALADFKNFYDNNAPIGEVLPTLVRNYPRWSANLPLPELCAQMHRFMTEKKIISLLNEAFTDPVPPELVLTPGETYQRLIRGGTEIIRLSELAGRVVATQVATYPPSIPILMPGERAGNVEGPLLRYLWVLESFDREFPGFASETHGIHRDARGDYWIYCVKEPVQPAS